MNNQSMPTAKSIILYLEYKEFLHKIKSGRAKWDDAKIEHLIRAVDYPNKMNGSLATPEYCTETVAICKKILAERILIGTL